MFNGGWKFYTADGEIKIATTQLGVDTAERVFKFTSPANPQSATQEPPDFVPYDCTIQEVWLTGDARASTVTLVLYIEEVATTWVVAAPTLTSAGGVGTRRVPNTVNLATDDKLEVGFTGANGTGPVTVNILVELPL